MSGWLVVLILALMVAASIVIIVVSRGEDVRRQKQRKRFELEDSGERVPLAPERAARPVAPIQEIASFVGTATDSGATKAAAETREERALESIAAEEDHPVPQARFVTAIDGETLLTRPPFKRRDSIFSKRHGRYALGLIRRLPPWLAVCPKVRLDTLVAPTSPDGRDPEDWREWRRRVRMRSVDLVLVDHRTWEPILAIMLEREHPTSAVTVGGGKDRMIDEVLATIGLPLVRGTGSLREDWAAIRPYVENAMLPTEEDGDRDPLLGGAAWDASAAVKLLRMDDERGGLLE
jgi:hypothetical protein